MTCFNCYFLSWFQACYQASFDGGRGGHVTRGANTNFISYCIHAGINVVNLSVGSVTFIARGRISANRLVRLTRLNSKRKAPDPKLNSAVYAHLAIQVDFAQAYLAYSVCYCQLSLPLLDFRSNSFNMQTSALMTSPLAVQSRIVRPSSIRSFRAPSAPVAARRNFVVRAEVCNQERFCSHVWMSFF